MSGDADAEKPQRLHADNSKLHESLKDARSDLARKERRLAKATARSSQLEKLLAATESEADELRQQCTARQTELAGAEERVRKVQDRLGDAIRGHEARVGQLSQRNTANEALLEEKLALVEKLRAQLAESQSELAAVQKLFDDAKAVNDKQIVELREAIVAKEGQVENITALLQKQQEKHEGDTKRLSESNHEISSRLRDSAAVVEDLRSKLKDEKNALEGVRQQLADANSSAANTTKELQAAITAKGNEITHLQALLEERKQLQMEELRTLSEEKAQSCSLLDESRASIRSLEAKLDEANTSAFDLQQQLEQARSSAESDKMSLQGLLDEKERHVASVEALLSEEKERSAEATRILAEAIESHTAQIHEREAAAKELRATIDTAENTTAALQQEFQSAKSVAEAEKLAADAALLDRANEIARLAQLLAEENKRCEDQAQKIAQKDSDYTKLLTEKQAAVDGLQSKLEHAQRIAADLQERCSALSLSLDSESQTLQVALSAKEEEVSSLTAELAELNVRNREEIRIARIEYEETCDLLKESKSSCAALEMQLSEARQAATDAEDLLVQTKTASEINTGQLEIALSAKEDEISLVEQLLCESDEKLKNCEIEVQELQVDLNQKEEYWSEQMVELSRKHEKTQSLLSDSQLKLEHLETDLEVAQTEVKDLQRQLKDVEEKFGRISQDHAELVAQKEDDIDSLSAKLCSSRKEVEEFTAQAHNLKAELKKLMESSQQRISELEQELESAQLLSSKTAAEREDLKMTLGDVNKQLESSRDKIAALSESMKDIQDENERTAEKSSTLEAQLVELQKQSLSQAEALASTEKQKRSFVESLQTVEFERDEIAKELSVLQENAVGAVQAAQEDAHIRIADLTTSQDAMQEELDILRAEKDKNEQKLATLQNKLAAEERDREEATHSMNTQSVAFNKLREERNALEDLLSKQIEAAQSVQSSKDNAIDRLTQEVADLSAQMERVKSENTKFREGMDESERLLKLSGEEGKKLKQLWRTAQQKADAREQSIKQGLQESRLAQEAAKSALVEIFGRLKHLPSRPDTCPELLDSGEVSDIDGMVSNANLIFASLHEHLTEAMSVRTELSTTQKDMRSLEEANASLKHENEGLQTSLEEVKSSAVEQEQKLVSMRERQRKSDELIQMHKEVSECASNQLREQERAVEASLITMQRRQKSLEDELSSATCMYEKTLSALQESSSSLHEAANGNLVLERKIAELSANLAATTADKEKAQKLLETSQKLQEEARSQAGEREKRLTEELRTKEEATRLEFAAKSRSASEEAAARMEVLKKAAEDSESEIESLRQIADTLTEKLNSNEASSTSRIRILETKLQTAERAHDVLLQRKEELETEAVEYQQKVAELLSKVEGLCEAADTKEAAEKAVKRRLESAQAAASKLEGMLERTRSELSEARQEYEGQLQSQLEHAQTLQGKLSEEQQKQLSLQKQSSKQTAEIERLELVAAQLKKEKEDADKELSALKDDLDGKLEDIKLMQAEHSAERTRLSTSLKEMTSKFSRTNVALDAKDQILQERMDVLNARLHEIEQLREQAEEIEKARVSSKAALEQAENDLLHVREAYSASEKLLKVKSDALNDAQKALNELSERSAHLELEKDANSQAEELNDELMRENALLVEKYTKLMAKRNKLERKLMIRHVLLDAEKEKDPKPVELEISSKRHVSPSTKGMSPSVKKFRDLDRRTPFTPVHTNSRPPRPSSGTHGRAHLQF